MEPHREGHATLWAALAVLLAAWSGIPWAAAFAGALPPALRRWHGHRADPGFVVRWAAAVLVTTVVIVALAGDHAARSVPLGPEGAAHARAWLAGTGAAVPGTVFMIAATLAFAAAAALTRGTVGWLLLAGVTQYAAVAAVVVCARSRNVIEGTLVAFPAWTLVWIAALALLFEPLAARAQAVPAPGNPGEAARPRAHAVTTGAALVVLAILLRALLASPYSRLAERLTIR